MEEFSLVMTDSGLNYILYLANNIFTVSKAVSKAHYRVLYILLLLLLLLLLWWLAFVFY